MVGEEEAEYDYVEINGDLVKVLRPDDHHRYLGRHICMSPNERLMIEFRYRKQQAWPAFHKHKRTLLESKMSLRSRLRYFDAFVVSAMLFALSVFPVTMKMLTGMATLQRKMMRRIVD